MGRVPFPTHPVFSHPFMNKLVLKPSGGTKQGTHSGELLWFTMMLEFEWGLRNMSMQKDWHGESEPRGTRRHPRRRDQSLWRVKKVSKWYRENPNVRRWEDRTWVGREDGHEEERPIRRYQSPGIGIPHFIMLHYASQLLYFFFHKLSPATFE